MTETGVPELYDIEKALREVAQARQRRDELTRQQVMIGDQLALHLDRHFAAEELETAGRALLIGTASAGSLVEIPAAVILNILGFAGARLIKDGREWDPPAE